MSVGIRVCSICLSPLPGLHKTDEPVLYGKVYMCRNCYYHVGEKVNHITPCMKCGKELFENDTYTSDSLGNLCWECNPINTPSTKETVNHPSHYNQGKIEVIDFIEDQGLGFHDGNALKYICRHRHKGKPIEDIKKAMWYLERLLKELECGQKVKSK